MFSIYSYLWPNTLPLALVMELLTLKAFRTGTYQSEVHRYSFMSFCVPVGDFNGER